MGDRQMSSDAAAIEESVALKRGGCYADIILSITDEAVVLEPLVDEKEKHTLWFNRDVFAIETGGPAFCTEKDYELVHGILGIIRLNAGPYLIVISQRDKVGDLFGSSIYKITKTKIVRIAANIDSLTEEEKRLDKEYIAQLMEMLEQLPLFFGYETDLTRSVQRKYTEVGDASLPLWMNSDEKFFWNFYISQDLISAGLHDWVLPVIQGYVQVDVVEERGATFQFALISRRCCKRAGTRYQTRGIDTKGNVANFVESEQIVVHIENFSENIAAFTQVRGSIPVFWHQPLRAQSGGPKYTPTPVLDKVTLDTTEAFQLHMESLLEQYGKVGVVNLIHAQGDERIVGEAFEKQLRLFNVPNVTYVPFDFHDFTKGSRFDRLEILLEMCQRTLTDHRFLVVKDGEVLETQRGVIRSNCIDCLDRTNVAQSVFGRHVLPLQLQAVGAIESLENVHGLEKLDGSFKNAWANHGDQLSVQYTGTGSLKNDFTRTGKRSMEGMINDGVKSIKRFYSAHFSDESKQDIIDFFLGNFEVESSWVGRTAVADPENIIHRCEATKVNKTGVLRKCDLEINQTLGLFSFVTKPQGQLHTFELASLSTLEKNLKNRKSLTMGFVDRLTYDFVFLSCRAREMWCVALDSALFFLAQKRRVSGENIGVKSPTTSRTPIRRNFIPPVQRRSSSTENSVGNLAETPDENSTGNIPVEIPTGNGVDRSVEPEAGEREEGEREDGEGIENSKKFKLPESAVRVLPSSFRRESDADTENSIPDGGAAIEKENIPTESPVSNSVEKTVGAVGVRREETWTADSSSSPQTKTIYVGSWDLGYVGPKDSTLDVWAPKDSPDVCVFAAQRCVYESRDCESDWLQSLQTRMCGYRRVVAESQKHIRILVLAKENLFGSISNVESVRIRLGTEDLDEIPTDIGAVAVSFKILETSFFFLNVFLPVNSSSKDRMNSLGEIFRRSSVGAPGIDAPSQFHHCVIVGGLNFRLNLPWHQCEKLISDRNWTTLMTFDQLHIAREQHDFLCAFHEGEYNMRPSMRYARAIEKGEERGTAAVCDRILWKNFPKTHMIKTASHVLPAQSSLESSPLSAVFEAEIILPVFRLESTQFALIELADLRAPNIKWDPTQSLLSRSLSLADPFLTFAADFIEDPVSTSVVMKTINPRWKEKITLAPFVSEIKYLERQHIIVSLWDHNSMRENELLGQGVISLRDCVDGRPVAFAAVLSLHGKQKCTVHGTLQTHFGDRRVPPEEITGTLTASLRDLTEQPLVFLREIATPPSTPKDTPQSSSKASSSDSPIFSRSR